MAQVPQSQDSWSSFLAAHTPRRLRFTRVSRGAVLILFIFLGGCAAPTLPALPVATPPPTPPAAILALTPTTLGELVRIERAASIEGNLPLLATLWAAEARIVDGRGTPDPADDYIWQGRAAILSRYTLAVFPAPPPPLNAADLAAATLTVHDDTATLVNGDDRWRMVQRDGRWWLLELVYSAP